MSNKCIICDNELVVLKEEVTLTCSVCKNKFRTKLRCPQGHYICESCHGADAMKYIEIYCKNTFEKDPFKIASEIMKNNKIKIQGPDHHFLVPAVLLTGYYNTLFKHEKIEEKIEIIKDRYRFENSSANVFSFFEGECTFHGNCGAGTGTGIFISVIDDESLSLKNKWKLSNIMTINSLKKILQEGEHRHCKKNTYIAIESAVDSLEVNLRVKLPKTSRIK